MDISKYDEYLKNLRKKYVSNEETKNTKGTSLLQKLTETLAIVKFCLFFAGVMQNLRNSINVPSYRKTVYPAID
jgi:hypothetical protein